MTRTIEDVLKAVSVLREFRKANFRYFETHPDAEDLIILADEVERLRGVEPEPEEDHDESW